MAEDFSGFSDEQVKNAAFIKDSMDEINNLTRSYNRALGGTNAAIADVANDYRQIKNSADQVVKVQQQAAKSSAATRDAIKEQNKQLNVVARLNARIDRLYAQAANSSGTTRDNLLSQARVIESARDNAKSLASSFQKIAEDSTTLTGSNYVFSTLGELVKKLPGGDVFGKPFEAAAEAARKTTLENAKQTELRGKLGKLTTDELKTGRGLTKQRIKDLGLENELGNLRGKGAANRLKTLKASAKTSSSMMSGLQAGAKALGPALTKAFLPLAIADAVVKAIKFVVDLFVAADQNATQIAKNLGISKANAEGIRKEFVKIAGSSTNILATSKALLEAQKDLLDFTGAVTLQSFQQADAQILLTKNLGMSGQNAAKLQAVLGTTGTDIDGIVESTRVMADEQFKTNGYFISNQQILQDIGNTSAEIAGYYGFSADNLAKAAFQTRKFGLSLSQAKNISEGLLDFEKSISSELELELLTGKQFNLERARALALTGDMAGATEEVMKEMSKMTEAQRQNPILMKSFSELTGLSADELNRAYLVQNQLNQSQKKYIADLKAKGRYKEADLAAELGLQGLTKDQIEKNISAQDKFNAALEKAKDQFTGLVDSGALDGLVDLLVDFVNRASKVGIFRAMIGGPGGTVKTGKDAAAALGTSEDFSKRMTEDRAGAINSLQSVIDKRRRLGDVDQSTITMLASKYGDVAVKEALKNLMGESSKSANQYTRAAGNIYGNYEVGGQKVKDIDVNDFTIRANPKDTLVMAGGTKFGEETNTLLRQLIAAVEGGKVVTLDGRKVSEGLALGSSKLDRY